MGCGASTPSRVRTDDEPPLPSHKVVPSQQGAKEFATPTYDVASASSDALAKAPPRSVQEIKKAWIKSFTASDPRHHLADFFKPGDERGPFGCLRMQGLRPRGPSSEYFSVWRPTSLTAIRMLFEGTATGKGLNVKGKSALKGPLSGFVPFLQISEESHKALCGTSPPEARTHIYYRNPIAREAARKQLQAVMLSMEVGARQGSRQIADMKAGTLELSSKDMEGAAHRASTWACTDYELRKLNEYTDKGVYGLDVPERVMWEAYVVRQDIRHKEGWETGRASEPAFMDLNMHAVRDGKEPRAAVWQDDGQDPMNPRRLLIAHVSPESVKPVASDIDAFLIGSKGMKFHEPLPAEQCELLDWCLSNVESVLQSPGPQGWTKRWLEVLKETMNKGGLGVEMPQYGFGDPQSYEMMKRAVQKLKFCGAVRHGAECFNFWFPQELDDEFLVVWDGFPLYGSRVPWRYMNREGLRSFLMARVGDGYAFPLNPKWVLCDEGWIDVFRAVQASPYAREALASWLPPESGLLERINTIASLHPNGFRPVAPQEGEIVEAALDQDVAEYELRRSIVLKRARNKLRAVFKFSMMAQQGQGRREEEGAAVAEEVKLDGESI